jgi:hypothetical protein
VADIDKLERLREVLAETAKVLEAAQEHVMVCSVGTLNALAAAVHSFNAGETERPTLIDKLRELTVAT